MPGKAVIFFIVEGYFLFPIFNGADDFFFLALFFEEAFYAEAIGMVLGVLAFAAGKIATGKAEVIDGVEQVGFTGTISAGDTNDPLLKAEVLPGVVFELYK